MLDKQSSPDVKPSPSGTPRAASTSTSTSTTTGREDAGERPKKARRTFLTQNACTRCRQKKSKCDGKRPTCARCEKHGADCLYDIAQEGITRMQNLQNQLGSKTAAHDKLKRLFGALQRGTDQEATTLLARLRLGDSIDDLLSYVGEAEPSSSSTTQTRPSPTESQQSQQYLRRWPSSPLHEPSAPHYWSPERQPPPPDSTLAIREAQEGTYRPEGAFRPGEGYPREGQGYHYPPSASGQHPHQQRQGSQHQQQAFPWTGRREGRGSPFFPAPPPDAEARRRGERGSQ